MKKDSFDCPVILTLGFLLIFSGCTATIPQIPAQGQVLGENISTHLDAEIARYYLENYLKHDRIMPGYDEKIDQLYQRYSGFVPDREDLKEISDIFSPDFAALFWAEKLHTIPKNKKLQSAFREKLSRIKTAQKRGSQLSITNVDCCILLFVPGWNYREVGHMTGADMAAPLRIAQSLGVESHLLKIDALGSVEENAAFIADAIRFYSSAAKPLIIAGPSSAGPAIHLALGRLLSAKQSVQVVAWMNLGGLLQGTPLLEHFESWPKSWLLKWFFWSEGWQAEKAQSLSMANSRRRFKSLNLPEGLWVLNYIGLSLSGKISHFAEDSYAMLRQYGPNDGLTLLPDSIVPGSQSIIALQSDHFFSEDPEIDLKTLALMQVIFEEIAAPLPPP